MHEKNYKAMRRLYLLNYVKIAFYIICITCFPVYTLVKFNNSEITFYSIVYKLQESTTKVSSFVRNWSFENILNLTISKQSYSII